MQVLNLAATFEPTIERGSRGRVIKRLPTYPVIKGGIELTHCMSDARGVYVRQHHRDLARCDRIYYNRERARAMIQPSRDGPFSLLEVYRRAPTRLTT